MAVSSPKQRFRPCATLYSPPPSETSKLRVVQMRRSPGSKRSMTSPRLTRSQRHCSFGLRFRLIEEFPLILFQGQGPTYFRVKAQPSQVAPLQVRERGGE